MPWHRIRKKFPTQIVFIILTRDSESEVQMQALKNSIKLLKQDLTFFMLRQCVLLREVFKVLPDPPQNM